jgi:hypothetical protein
MSRTVIDATTSSRASFSLTLLRRMSLISTLAPFLFPSLLPSSLLRLLALPVRRRYAV